MLNSKSKGNTILHYHICSPFMSQGGYLENIMPKYYNTFFDNVVLLATNKELMRDGSINYVEPKISYDTNGVEVIRLDISKFSRFKKTSALDGLFIYKEIYQELKRIRPDFMVVGDVGSLCNFPIAKYVKKINPDCKIVCLSHATVENVDRHNHKLRRRIWDLIITMQNMYMSRYYRKVYGILPNAVDYLVKRFGIPAEKTDLLPLGYDDELIHFDKKNEIRKQVRSKYGIDEDDYLVVHGGKLSSGKKTKEFVKSLSNLNDNVSAIIFGDFGTHIYGEGITDEYELLVKDEARKDDRHRIVFSGALNQEEIYNLYLAADLAVFPGAPSCLRQEAVGAGLPIIMYVNPGDEGININIDNNAIYLYEGWNTDDLAQAIRTIYEDNSYHERAYRLANNQYSSYSYRKTAERIIKENYIF